MVASPMLTLLYLGFSLSNVSYGFPGLTQVGRAALVNKNSPAFEVDAQAGTASKHKVPSATPIQQESSPTKIANSAVVL